MISTIQNLLTLAGRLEDFLRNDVHVLAKLVVDICNLSISLNKFPRAFSN